MKVRLAEVRLNVLICFPPLIPCLHPLLQPCEMFLVRHHSALRYSPPLGQPIRCSLTMSVTANLPQLSLVAIL